MPADGRFGGHIVAGHIDGTGIVDRNYQRRDRSLVPDFRRARSYLTLYRGKGLNCHRWNQSDGSQSQRERLSRVSIIPHTQGRDDRFPKEKSRMIG